jgi:hypothetical protein
MSDKHPDDRKNRASRPARVAATECELAASKIDEGDLARAAESLESAQFALNKAQKRLQSARRHKRS